MGGRGECSARMIVGNYDSSCDNYHHLKEPLVSYVFQEVGLLHFCLNLGHRQRKIGIFVSFVAQLQMLNIKQLFCMFMFLF